MIVLEKTYLTPISTIATHPTDYRVIAIGFYDGVIHCCLIGSGSPGKDKVKLERVWMNKLKRAVRELDFSEDGEFLYAICANRALCAYEVKNGRRVRCIQRGHITARPSSLKVLPSYSTHAEFATGAEDGEVKFVVFVTSLRFFVLNASPLLLPLLQLEYIIQELKYSTIKLLNIFGFIFLV